jgi:hypothetical protein
MALQHHAGVGTSSDLMGAELLNVISAPTEPAHKPLVVSAVVWEAAGSSRVSYHSFSEPDGKPYCYLL